MNTFNFINITIGAFKITSYFLIVITLTLYMITDIFLLPRNDNNIS